MSAIYDAHKKKVGFEQLYNLVHKKFDELEIRCGRENQYPAEWAPRSPIEQPRSGGQYVAVLFSLQLTSHTVKPLVTPSNPFK